MALLSQVRGMFSFVVEKCGQGSCDTDSKDDLFAIENSKLCSMKSPSTSETNEDGYSKTLIRLRTWIGAPVRSPYAPWASRRGHWRCTGASTRPTTHPIAGDRAFSVRGDRYFQDFY